jgi:UDP-2-acetamido-2-deoxy-ribo-hexuluronate aminotransferase
MLPFIDLPSQFKRIQSEVEERVISVLRSGQYILGPEVSEFEDKLAEFAKVKHAISCSSGTDALIIALMAKGVGPGDAIFTSPFTYFATAEAIALLGATPIFVDIDINTFNIDPSALKSVILALKKCNTSNNAIPKRLLEELRGLNPKGIITVDLFGLPADHDRINLIAAENDLFVIEDAAQGFGGQVNGRCAGTLAEVGCTSFFPAKPLGCYGDGGALFTNDDDLASLFRSIRVHGKGVNKYENVRLGINGRLDALQAAVLIPKLNIFSDELHSRQRAALTYEKLISSANLNIITPKIPDGYLSAWAQYSILAPDQIERQRFLNKLKAAGVPTMIYYKKPLHLQKALSHLGYKAGDFPVSEDASERIFSLPMHPYLDENTISGIIEAMAH